MQKIREIYLVCGKTALRHGIAGLAVKALNQFQLTPYSKSLYHLFCGTRKDRFAALDWEENLEIYLPWNREN